MHVVGDGLLIHMVKKNSCNSLKVVTLTHNLGFFKQKGVLCVSWS